MSDTNGAMNGLPLFDQSDPPCPHCGKRASEPVREKREKKELTRADVLARWRQVQHKFPPFAVDSATSLDAARYIAAHGLGLRLAVLAYIASRGDSGCTDDQGAAATGIYRYTYAPRRTELLHVGLVEDTGSSAPTGRGTGAVEATLWRVPAEVRPLLEPGALTRTGEVR